MRTWLIYVLLGCFLFSCDNTATMNKETNNIVGKYVNSYENAEHYIVLKKDSTFTHYYKKSQETSKENKGTWSISIDAKKTEIKFDEWIDYGYTDESSCDGCYRFVRLKDGEMVFSSDLPNEMNFKKVE